MYCRFNFNISSDLIDENFINSQGSSSKGFSAIEYLLFKGAASTLIHSFSNDSNSDRRLDYLVAATKNLDSNAIKLASIWVNYEDDFINAIENGTDGSQNEVINSMVFQLESIIITKLRRALGDHSGGSSNFMELEVYRSGLSLDIIKKNLYALERYFTGEFTSTPINAGFTDYLAQLGDTELSQRILDTFESCKKSANSIDLPLE